MIPGSHGRIFHTDQGRWDRRDFQDDHFNQYYDDNETRHSIQGHPDESLDISDDDYNKPSGHIYSDEELENVIRELFKNSHQIESEDITIRAYNCDVTLSGTVKTEEEKNAATSMVLLIHGIGLVHNELIVKRNEGILPTDIGRNPG